LPVINDFGGARPDLRSSVTNKAKAALREQNKSEWQCDLTIMGNAQVAAGVTFNVEGFGAFDGKYIADTVTHLLDGGGYTTNIKGHRVLVGY